ncbi:MAG: carbon-nitrogen hydrolase family protein [Planctomycetota bacterium]|jgi:predicted amidohydrolase
MKTSIRIAQIRVVPAKGDLDGNHGKLMSVLGDMANEDVDVVVTPECFLDGYIATEESVNRDNIRDYAIDPAESPYVDAARAWAGENRAWVVFGCSRLSPEGVYNTAIVLNRNGDLAGWYDKTHCQTHDSKFVPGRKLPVFDSDFGHFGVLICADRRWPETVRSLAVQGARVIVNPTYGMHDERNTHMMQTRSFESEVFIAFTHPEQSLLTAPEGTIVCNDTGQDADYSVTEIDLSAVDAVRAGNASHLKDRRTDLYVNDTPGN